MNIIDKAKKMGNVISEFDNADKLSELNQSVYKDTIRNFIGSQHGDWSWDKINRVVLTIKNS